jgi:hypothetical protein
MKCVVCKDGVGSDFILCGTVRMAIVCNKCVISLRECSRRMVVMAEVCESVAATLSSTDIPDEKTLLECSDILKQAAQCASYFTRGVPHEKENAPGNDDRPRDVPRGVPCDGEKGSEEKEEARLEEESVQRVREALLK